MNRTADKLTRFSGEIIRETPAAYQLLYDDIDGNEVRDWFPKSQISLISNDGTTLVGEIPVWLAEKKNLS